jgi:phosphate transport system substrate-binding protein
MNLVKISLILIAGSLIVIPRSPAQETAEKPSANTISYYGCHVAKKAFMEEVSKAFEQEKGVGVTINGGSATKGITAAASGKADLGGGCRHKTASPEEKDAVGTIVAWDALVLIVHKENPVQQIPGDKIQDIFTGKIKNWKELGGVDAPIAVYTRSFDEFSGTDHMASELMFNNTKVQYNEESVKLTATTALEMGVESNPLGIAVTGISSGYKRAVNFLTIDGIEPSYENIATGKYPYTRPLYLFTNKIPTPHAQDFIQFILSDKGQEIIKGLKIVTIADAKTGGAYEKYDAKMESINVTAWEHGEGHGSL